MIPEPTSPPSRRPRHSVSRVAWACIPLVVWLGAIAVASTDLASTTHTDAVIPDDLSVAVRKLAHLVEYAVLGLLAARGLRMLFPGFVPGVGAEALRRTAVAVIPFGAPVAVGLVVIWLVWRRR